MERFEKMFKEEYNKQSLFVFLSENCEGNCEKIETIKTEQLALKAFNDVLKHPNTDLEKYYIKELVNILVQMEIRAILPYLEKVKEGVVDDEGKVVIGEVEVTHAKFFHCLLDEPLCFDLRNIYVDDTEVLFSDYSVLNFDMGCDTSLKSFIMIGVDVSERERLREIMAKKNCAEPEKVISNFMKFLSKPTLVGFHYQDILDFLKLGKEVIFRDNAELKKIKELNPKGVFIFIEGTEDITLDEVQAIGEEFVNYLGDDVDVQWVADVTENKSIEVVVIR